MSSDKAAKTPEALRRRLVDLLTNFEQRLHDDDLRAQVRSLIPAYETLRELGTSLVDASSARKRILKYLLRYPRRVIAGEELMVVAGISEWARRVRELRVEHGWPIVSGAAARAMAEEGESPLERAAATEMRPNDYILLDTEQDREAAYRWNLANEIRKSGLSMREKLLEYLRQNVGKPVTGEELRYVASKGSTWARRIRELRTHTAGP